MSLGAEDVLGEARRRAAALDTPYDRAQAAEVIAAAALAVLGVEGAAADLGGADRLRRLGSTAAELDVDAGRLVALLDRAGCMALARSTALRHLCEARLERGDVSGAEAALRHLRDVDAVEHDDLVGTVVRTCVAAGELDRATEIAASVLRPKHGAYGYYLIVEAHVAAGRVANGERLLKRIREKEWRASATRAVARAYLRAGDQVKAAPLLAAMRPRDLAQVIAHVGRAWLADGRVDDTLALVDQHRAAMGDETASALTWLIAPLARHAWDRAAAIAEAFALDNVDAFDEWLRALTAAGREDLARAWRLQRPIALADVAVARGLADRGDLDGALRVLADCTSVLPQAIEEAVAARVAALDTRGAIAWLLSVVRDVRDFDGLGGRIISLLEAAPEPSLFDEVADAFAGPAFAGRWLPILHERAAWCALASDDAPRAHANLRAMLALDPSRAPYLTLAWGQLAAVRVARGDATTIAAVDELLALVEPPLRPIAWAEAARSLGLRARGLVTRLR